MAEMWKSATHETLKYWIDTILQEASDELSAWELKFISDMETRIINKWELNESQQKKLEQIYATRTK